MFQQREHDLGALAARLGKTRDADTALMTEVIAAACRRYPSLGQSEKTARLEGLIRSGAWTDAALALIDLELPLWQVRRIVYDDGEWYCALSRERELPDWLDQCIEGRHAELSLAILSAFLEAQRLSLPKSRTSVPAVHRGADELYEPVCCDHFA
jgi:hypothetical protein